MADFTHHADDQVTPLLLSHDGRQTAVPQIATVPPTTVVDRRPSRWTRPTQPNPFVGRRRAHSSTTAHAAASHRTGRSSRNHSPRVFVSAPPPPPPRAATDDFTGHTTDTAVGDSRPPPRWRWTPGVGHSVVELQVETMTSFSTRVLLYSWYAILALALVLQSSVALQWEMRGFCDGAPVSLNALDTWNSSRCVSWEDKGGTGDDGTASTWWHGSELAPPPSFFARRRSDYSASDSSLFSYWRWLANQNDEINLTSAPTSESFVWLSRTPSNHERENGGDVRAARSVAAASQESTSRGQQDASVSSSSLASSSDSTDGDHVYDIRWVGSGIGHLLDVKLNRFVHVVISLASPMEFITPAQVSEKAYRVLVALEEAPFTPHDHRGTRDGFTEEGGDGRSEPPLQGYLEMRHDGVPLALRRVQQSRPLALRSPHTLIVNSDQQSSPPLPSSACSSSSTESTPSFVYTFNTTVLCFRDQPHCSTIMLPPSVAIATNASRMTLTLLVVDAELVEVSPRASVGLVYQRAQYTIATMVWRYGFLAYTVVALLRFFVASRRQVLLYEQYWVMVLQFALIGYLDPLFAAGVYADAVTAKDVYYFAEFHLPFYFAAIMACFPFAVIAASFDWAASTAQSAPDGLQRVHTYLAVPQAAAASAAAASSPRRSASVLLPADAQQQQEEEVNRARTRRYPAYWVNMLFLLYVLVVVGLDVAMSFVEDWQWGTEAVCNSRACQILRRTLQGVILAGVAGGCLGLYWLRHNLNARPYLENRPQQLASRFFIFIFFSSCVYAVVQGVLAVVFYPQLLAVVYFQPMLQLSPLMVATVFVNDMAYLYTPTPSSKRVPIRPSNPLWRRVVWPKRWYRWLDSHGGSMYIFWNETEERRFVAIQKGEVSPVTGAGVRRASRRASRVHSTDVTRVPSTVFAEDEHESRGREEAAPREQPPDGRRKSEGADVLHPTPSTPPVEGPSNTPTSTTTTRGDPRTTTANGRHSRHSPTLRHDRTRSCPSPLPPPASVAAATATADHGIDLSLPTLTEGAATPLPPPLPLSTTATFAVGPAVVSATTTVHVPNAGRHTDPDTGTGTGEDSDDDSSWFTSEDVFSSFADLHGVDYDAGGGGGRSSGVWGGAARHRVFRQAERRLLGGAVHMLDLVEDAFLDRPLYALLHLRLQPPIHHFFNLETAIDCLNMSWEAYGVAESLGDTRIETGFQVDVEAVPGATLGYLERGVRYALGCCFACTPKVEDEDEEREETADNRHTIAATPGYQSTPPREESTVDELVTPRLNSPQTPPLPTAAFLAFTSSSNGAGDPHSSRREQRDGLPSHAVDRPPTALAFPAPSMTTTPTTERETSAAPPRAPPLRPERFGYQRVAVVEGGDVQVIITRMDTEQVAAHHGKWPRLLVAFRGTDNVANALQDIRFHQRTWKEMETGGLFRERARVHSGFLEIWMTLKERVLSTVLQELRHLFQSSEANPDTESRPTAESGSQHPTMGSSPLTATWTLPFGLTQYDKIYVTGHSLGGALASLCAYSMHRALLLMHYPEPDPIVYTFGQPRVGNGTFRKLYNRAVPNTFRVVNEMDAVSGFNFLGGHHVGVEVVIDRHGNYICQPMSMERRFRPMRGKGFAVQHHTIAAYAQSLNAIADHPSAGGGVCPARCLVSYIEEDEREQNGQGRSPWVIQVPCATEGA